MSCTSLPYCNHNKVLVLPTPRFPIETKISIKACQFNKRIRGEIQVVLELCNKFGLIIID